MTTEPTRPRLEQAKADLERMKAAATTDDPAELLIDVPAGELFLHGRIGELDITAKAVSASLKLFKGKPVRLHINSPGGSVTEGVSIYNALRRYEGQLTAIVDGVAGSIASFILCGAAERLIDRNSVVMIHRPWSAMVGDEEAMQREAELLKRFGAMVSGVYSRATGKSVSEIESAMADETWLFGREAVDWGICTAMVGGDSGYKPKRAAARRASIRAKNEEFRIMAEYGG